MQTFGGSVDDLDAIFAAAETAAAQMLTEKRTCDSCGVVFCLECGNAEGHKRGLGSTNCPGCGQKVA
jgi:predicted enzyme related to lactoylglutathione lyase